jgi:hypothetical protein
MRKRVLGHPLGDRLEGHASEIDVEADVSWIDIGRAVPSADRYR